MWTVQVVASESPGAGGAENVGAWAAGPSPGAGDRAQGSSAELFQAALPLLLHSLLFPKEGDTTGQAPDFSGWTPARVWCSDLGKWFLTSLLLHVLSCSMKIPQE